eukprot:scaffold98802_cov70-Cyclotella_meneghiniana.AAC.5
MLSSLLGVAALSGVSPAVAASATQCDDGDGLLTVTLPDGMEQENRDNLLSIDVRPSGNVGNSSVLEYESCYGDCDGGFDYALCIPRENACFEVFISGTYPSSDYQITWDGEEVVVDQELFDEEFSSYYSTSTELGSSCSLDCEEGEGLFDYEEWVHIGPSSFKVENAGGEVVASASFTGREFGISSGVFKHKACLPTSSCYLFAVANRYPSQGSTHIGSYLLRFNGEAEKMVDKFEFDQTQFGEDCQAPCSGDESKLDVLLFHNELNCMDGEPVGASADYTWSVTKQEGGESTIELATGQSVACSGLQPHFETVCLPRNTCFRFDIAGSRNNLDEWGNYTSTRLKYSLELDGSVYLSNGNWYIRDVDTAEFLGISGEDNTGKTTLIGDCTKDDVSPDEDLLRVVYHTPEGSISYFDWEVKKKGKNSSGSDPVSSSSDFYDGYRLLPDTKYVSLMNIPESDCNYELKSFNGMSDARASVELNGVELLDEPSFPRDSKWTILGEDCSASSKMHGWVSITSFGCMISATLLLLQH